VTPYELFYGKRPDYKDYVPFWAKGMAHIYKDERTGPKHAPRARIVRNISSAVGYKDSHLVVEESSRAEYIRKDIHWSKAHLTFIT
jgi:hypothetical protein